MARIAGSGGGGGGGCFLGHTLVRTPDGPRAIETLQPGDLVVSFDDQGQLHHAKVLKVHVHEGERVVRYRLWGGALLDATPNHWVLNQFNAFVEIGSLGGDDCLVDENDHLRPIVERTEHGRGTVYNLTVEGHHTFIAGGVRVHNAGLGLGKIAGAGGGGGGGGKGGGGGSTSVATPTEAADNLASTQYVKLIDLISEGEIQGLKNGSQSIFIGNTALQNPDGTYNFQNVTVETRNGTQGQTYIELTADVEDEKGVSVTVTKAAPVVRTITDTNVDAVRVTITVPQLQIFDTSGNIKGTTVELQIAVQYNGGGYTNVISDKITGRTADQYQRDYLVDLTGAFPVDIKVTRVTADSSSAKLMNAFSWSSYTEITYSKLRYPNSALVALRVDAEQFNNIPQRSYLVRGIKVRIPNNATVDSATGRLIYAGVWTGTFGAAAWTTDPAWILWDLLTSTRYGFGDHIDATQLDKWAFYSASQYCAELVNDGFGGQEPRFSCNINIQTAEEAYKLINDMCSVFRAMPYWSTGALTISQDKPADVSYLFTLANVSEEGFTYQGSSRKTRPTVAVVSYLNLDTRDMAYEVVEDAENIDKYGVIKTEISAFACTSRGQASRIGNWLLYSERYEAEVVNFTVSIDAGVVVRPGQIIEISDPVRAGVRYGGRITTATTTTVTVDDATGLPTSNASVSVILPNGTVETRNITNRVGVILYVSPAFSTAPNANSVWVLQTTAIEASTWRVLTVQEQDGSEYAVTALAYNASKYPYVESGQELQPIDVTDLNIKPATPTNLQATEALYESNGLALAKLIISWQPITGVTSYKVRWKYEDDNWNTIITTAPDYEVLNAAPGLYKIEVYSLSAGQLSSVEPAKLSFQTFGKTSPPATPTGLNLIAIDETTAIISWDASTELDVILGGKVLIRHSVAIVGATWEESQQIVAAASGNQTQKQVPLLEGTYLIKFEDDTGNKSLNAAMAVVDLPTPQPMLLVQTYAEESETPPFNGNYTDMFYVNNLPEAGGDDGIMLSNGEDVDDMATDGDWDALPSIDSVGGVLPEGEYEFGSTYSLPGIFDLKLRRRLVTVPYLPGDLWDDKTENIDTWGYVDGTSGDAVNALTYVRTTSDDPSGTPIWSDWKEFANATVKGRGFQFKTIATSTDPALNILIRELGAELELEQRVEQAGPLTSGATAYVVTFANAFYQTPAIGITAYNMGTGDYFALTGTSRFGFTITFYNAAATMVSRSFTYTAVGYGKEV